MKCVLCVKDSDNKKEFVKVVFNEKKQKTRKSFSNGYMDLNKLQDKN